MLGGFVPVPISIPPTYDEVNSTIGKLHNAWQLLDRPVVLTSRGLAGAVRSLAGLLKVDEFRVAVTDDLRSEQPDTNWHAAQADDVVLMLLTSGSTGKPKAVMQSHRAILSRSAANAQMNAFTDLDVSLNWFPLDHVGGIVMFHINDLCLGCIQVHAPTQAVLRNPLRWLDLIERHRATITWAPNFAYGLINAQEEEIGQRRWDLSSMRFILNAGEAIVSKTARKFLQILIPHGLPATAMRPSWGMSETCSAVTYASHFTVDTSRDDDLFVEVGSPVPGFAVRIVNGLDQVTAEGEIGALQVKGPSVTSGYYRNPELNREIFTDDRWFATGDLGVVREGRLTITGRQKDVIIINGVNFYSHEIEAVVEDVAGVAVSFTAACAVRESGSDTDSLAVFFHAPQAGETTLAPLLKEIRGRVVRNIGVNPTFLVPVPKQDIPKTEIGKIQRAQLRKRFEAGDFAEILQRIDSRSGKSRTLPDWFHRTTWRRKDLVAFIPPASEGTTFVFLDSLGLGKRICAELERLHRRFVTVESGPNFACLGPGRYRVRPDNGEDYGRLFDAADDGSRFVQVIHLWTYEAGGGEVDSPEALENALKVGVYSVLALIQALGVKQDLASRFRVLVVSSMAQPIRPGERIAYERAPLLGLVQTVTQEMPNVDCRHVDLSQDDTEVDASRVLHELGGHGDREVAYRDGMQRLVPRLERVNLVEQPIAEVPFREGGVYLITGGLGGIGVEIARLLLEQFKARVLLVGRSPMPDPATWDAILQRQDDSAERIRAYQSLREHGEVLYEAQDVGDREGMRRVVAAAMARWQRPLDGVIHLAGTYADLLLSNESPSSFAATLRPKALGAWVLHQLVREHTGAIYIHFSSVLSFFGGGRPYAAANRFLEAFSAYQRGTAGLQSFCYAWSLWDETGMSRGHHAKGALHAKGIESSSAEQGLHSLIAGLNRGQPDLLIGLDGTNRHVRRHLESSSCRMQQLCAYYTAATEAPPADSLAAVTVFDRYRTPSQCEFLAIPEIPKTATGTIDRAD